MLSFITLGIGYWIEPSYSSFFWAIMIGMILTSLALGSFWGIIEDAVFVYGISPIFYYWIAPSGFFSFYCTGVLTIIVIYLVKMLQPLFFNVIGSILALGRFKDR